MFLQTKFDPKKKRKNIKLLTNEQQKSQQNAKICCICKWKFKDKYVEDNKYRKVRDQLSLCKGIQRHVAYVT